MRWELPTRPTGLLQVAPLGEYPSYLVNGAARHGASFCAEVRFYWECCPAIPDHSTPSSPLPCDSGAAAQMIQRRGALVLSGDFGLGQRDVSECHR